MTTQVPDLPGALCANPCTSEEWRRLPGWSDLFHVSSCGRVRSDHFKPGRLRKTLDQGAGYLGLALSDGQGRRRTELVHRLVAAAFLGPRPAGLFVLHTDGCKTNNHPANLRYGTASDNNRDTVKHGTHYWTEKTHCPQGHLYNAENTRLFSRGDGRMFRTCLACSRARDHSKVAS